jgi:hypothetical protein
MSRDDVFLMAVRLCGDVAELFPVGPKPDGMACGVPIYNFGIRWADQKYAAGVMHLTTWGPWPTFEGAAHGRPWEGPIVSVDAENYGCWSD